MKKLLAIILSITMLLSMGTVAFADGVDGLMQKAKLTVGINAEFPPFEYYEGEELKGFDIDLMNYIGERIGFDIEFVNMSFDKGICCEICQGITSLTLRFYFGSLASTVSQLVRYSQARTLFIYKKTSI